MSSLVCTNILHVHVDDIDPLQANFTALHNTPLPLSVIDFRKGKFSKKKFKSIGKIQPFSKDDVNIKKNYSMPALFEKKNLTDITEGGYKTIHDCSDTILGYPRHHGEGK